MNKNQLWNSILQLAICGRLVPQLDSEAEVAQVGPVPTQDDVPFELPAKWKWIKLGKLLPFGGSKQVDPKQIPLGSWLLGLEEIESYGDLIRKCYDWKSVGSKKNVFCAGNVLYSKMRPYLNKVIVADEDGFCTTELLVLDVNKACVPLLNEFLLYFLRSPYFVSYAKSNTNGQKPRLDIEAGKQTLVPIPPLEEQRRIVARLEEIKPLVDNFDKAQEQLVKLEAEFPSKLKASVLQQAIRGELVPQLDCEPEVEQVGPAPKPDEVPFELPPKWKWVPLEKVCSYIQRGKAPKYSEIKQLPVVAQKCNQWDGLHMELALFIDPATIPSYKPERFLQPNDVLLNSTGTGTLGRVGLYEPSVNPYEQAVADGHVTVIRAIPNKVLPQFIKYVLTSAAFQAIILDAGKGTTNQRELALSIVKQLLIPLPPLEEQRRIVAKIDELLAGVKQLSSLMEYA